MKFHATMATMEARMVQKPAFLLVNFGNRSAPITLKEVPIARDNAYCIAPRIVPIWVAMR